MSDIFISYASEDKGRVQALARALERKGWSVWWDRRIPAGKSFDEVILEALKTARSVVVVWSKTSVKSTWVKNESRSGLRRNILFPVMLHNEVEIPIEFEHLQAAHLVDWRPGQDHAGFDQFLDDLAGLIGAPEKAGTQQPGPPVESPFPLEAREIPIIEPQAAQVDERRPRESAVSASSAQPLPYALIGGGLLAIVIAVSIYWLRLPEAPSPKIEPPSGQLPVQSSPTPSQTMTPPPITVPSRNPSSAVLPEKSVVAAEAKAVSPAELKPRLSADTAKKKSGKDGASTGAKPEETAETKLTKKPLDTPKTTARESDPSGPVRQLPEKQEQELLQVKQQLRKPDERSVPGLSSPLLQLAQPAQQQAMGHNVPSSHVQSTETFSPTITVEDGVPMVLVPAGEFMMGAGSVSSKYREDELPVHPVYLDGYYIDRYEVTTTRYATFLRATKRMAPKYWSDTVVQRHGRKPVIGVDWDDATAYCAWVGKRLPTEVEWEKAARGTDQRVYPWGNEVPSEQRANFSHCCSFKDYGVLTDVGSFEQGKSPFGVYDMVGNVEEWVLDWYDPRYYSKYYPARNPTGPSSGYYRMTRGGSWIDEPVNIRSACRRPAAPTYRNDDLGFRCAQDIPK